MKVLRVIAIGIQGGAIGGIVMAALGATFDGRPSQLYVTLVALLAGSSAVIIAARREGA